MSAIGVRDSKAALRMAFAGAPTAGPRASLRRRRHPGDLRPTRRLWRSGALVAALGLIALASAGPSAASPANKSGRTPAKSASPADDRSPADNRPQAEAAAKTQAVAGFGKQPLRFEANRGQAAPQVRFIARTARQTVLLTRTEMVLLPNDTPEGKATKPIRVKFAAAGSTPKVRGVGRLPGVTNYIQGPDEKTWKMGIPSFSKVAYDNVYPGIDLVFYEKGGKIEYDFVVSPGADPRKIAMRFSGAGPLSLSSGALVANTPAGKLTHAAPTLYQKVAGRLKRVQGAFRLQGAERAGFLIGRYDRSLPLIIDPVLAWSTYLSDQGSSGFQDSDSHEWNSARWDGTGTSENRGPQIALDAAGNAYLAGRTQSLELPAFWFPTQAAFQPTPAVGFVAKFNALGRLVYSTYLGDFQTAVHEIAVDAVGNALVVGNTSGKAFPTTANAFRPMSPQITPDESGSSIGRTNASFVSGFLTTLDVVGRPFYSTYLWPAPNYIVGGGPGPVAPIGVAAGEGGQVFVTGIDFNGTDPISETWAGRYRACAGSDGGDGKASPFVAKFDTAKVGKDSSVLIRCGVGGRDLAVQGSALYVLGGDDRPKDKDANYENKGLSKLKTEDLTGLAPAVPVTGLEVTASPAGDTGPWVLGLKRTTPNGPQQTVRRFSAELVEAGPAVVPSQGGVTLGIALDAQGRLHATGYSPPGAIAPTGTPFQGNFSGGPYDAFFVKFGPDGADVEYATWLGGSTYAPAGDSPDTGRDRGTGIQVDRLGNAYLTGITNSYDFPTKNAHQKERRERTSSDQNMTDVFAAKFTDALPLISGIVPPEGFTCEQTKVTITGTGFPDNPAVTFGGRPAEVLGVTHDPASGADTITVLSPKADLPGPAEVKVTSAGGNSSSTSLLGSFRYLPAPAPVIQSVSPKGGSPLGGEAATIRGSFACVTQIAFGDTPARDFKISPDRSTISATTPQHDPGPVHVLLTAPGALPALVPGQDADLYTFAPLITSVDPPTGHTLGGDKVKVNGKGFLRATRGVAFGGLPAGFSVVSDTEILATSPPHLAGEVLVGVSTAEDLQAVAKTAGANLFTYLLPKLAVDDGGDPGKGAAGGQKGIVQPVTPGGGTSAAPASQPAQAPNPQPLGNAQPTAGSVQAQVPVSNPGTAFHPGFTADPGGAPGPAPAAGDSDEQPGSAPRYAMSARDANPYLYLWTPAATALLLFACFAGSAQRAVPHKRANRRTGGLGEPAPSAEASPAPQIA